MALSKYIDFSNEAVEAASHWYSGQGDMLYAISSTGSLTIGTQRPEDDDGNPLDDDTWLYYLAGKCESSASRALKDAIKQANDIEKKLADGYYEDDDEQEKQQDELTSLANDIDGLEEIVRECEDFQARYEKERG